MARSSGLTEASWNNMLDRCYRATDPYFHRYGGRGIKVCERWRGPDGFQNFVEDIGRRPSRRHSIDRRDNDGDYTPDNCRWATPREQARNRSSNRRLKVDGETKTLVEWSECSGIPSDILSKRLAIGWTEKRAVSTPVLRPTDPNVGDRFGKWTVIEPAGRRDGGNKAYRCRCDCGNEQIVSSYALRKRRSWRCKPCAHRGNRNARR